MENQNVSEIVLALDLNASVEEIIKQLDVVPDDQLPYLMQAWVDLANKIDVVGDRMLKRTMKVVAKRVQDKVENEKLINGPVGNA